MGQTRRNCYECAAEPGHPHEESCRHYPGIDVLQVACPLKSCKAASGKPCKGRKTPDVHIKRTVRAQLGAWFEAGEMLAF